MTPRFQGTSSAASGARRVLDTLFERFRWQGPGRVYSLPWLKNRLEYSADPDRIAAYAKTEFTRSKLTMALLAQFHLSENSIVVSDDKHAGFMKKLLLAHLPSNEEYPVIARELVEAVFSTRDGPDAGRTIHLSSELLREVYKSLLSNILGVDISTPLAEYIQGIDFQPGSRPMHLDGLMYAFGLHLPAFAPIRMMVELVLYRGERKGKRIARGLERMIFELSMPRPGGWYSTLLELKASGRITPAQFRGELTSLLSSAFSLSAAISSMLLCLAARREYIAKIHREQRLARCFVNEVLRLYPPFRQFGYEQKGIWTRPGLAKTATTDFMLSIFALHRNRAAWQNPEKFHPERFLNPSAFSGCKYLPFGMGRRACPGRTYSMTMMVEILKYVCSDPCRIRFRLPEDYRGSKERLPIGTSGRLISFPIDDRLTYSRVGCRG